MNFLLGKYIAWAFNDPKNYPMKPFLQQSKKDELLPMTESEMEKQAKYNTVMMGGVIK